MKYGILGDIHSNLSALEAVLNCMESEDVGRLVSVGDVVGYGAAPKQCIDILRQREAVVVMGNHDAACAGVIDTLYFNRFARTAVRWTQSALSAEECNWLKSLPMRVDLPSCAVAHGTYARPDLFNYVRKASDADNSLQELTLPVCFVGHTHVPVTLLRLKDDPLRTALLVGEDLDLSDASRALVNVGSVGQPRDEDPRAAYAIYDGETARVEIKRVAYDIERESHRIREAGLPSVLADRLHLGV